MVLRIVTADAREDRFRQDEASAATIELRERVAR